MRSLTKATKAAAAARRAKTHCKHGHAFSEENTQWYITKRGSITRRCKQCRRDEVNIRRARQRDQFAIEQPQKFHKIVAVAIMSYKNNKSPNLSKLQTVVNNMDDYEIDQIESRIKLLLS